MHGDPGLNWTDWTKMSVKIHIPDKCHAKCTKIKGTFPNKSHINTQNQHPKDKYITNALILEALQPEVLIVATLT